MQIDLSNRTAIITDSSSDLGSVMSRTLAECGADIVIHFQSDESKALELKGQIIAQYGVRSIAIKADLTNIEEVFQLRNTVLSEFGRLDILVINSAAKSNLTPVTEGYHKDYKNLSDMCVLQSVHLIKAFIPQMTERNYGRVIGIQNACDMQTVLMLSEYMTANWNMNDVFRILVKEVDKHHITVNQVDTGWTINEKDEWSEKQLLKKYLVKAQLKRRGSLQEIANVVAFLASDLASFVTGIYLPVYGRNAIPSI